MIINWFAKGIEEIIFFTFKNVKKGTKTFQKMTRTVTWQPESGIIVNLAGDGILSVIRDL